MLSRVAESIYWMARYIERAENVARIMDANYHMILDLPPDVGEQWEPLVVTSGDEALFKEYRITSYNVCYTKLLRSPTTRWSGSRWPGTPPRDR